MEFLLLLGYVVIAVIVAGAFNHDNEGDPAGIMMGIFWFLSLSLLLIVLIFMCLSKLGHIIGDFLSWLWCDVLNM